MGESGLSTQFFISFVGVGAAAYLFRVNANYRSRIDRAFEMHREFSASEMQELRIKCFQMLALHPEKTASDLYSMSPLEANSFWILLSFFQRLNAGIRGGQVHRELASRLFGRLIVYWDNILFQEKIGTHTDEYNDMRELRHWLNSECHSKVVAQWEEAAQKQNTNISSGKSRETIILGAKQGSILEAMD